MVNEEDIEPDFYIDRPPNPVFKENPKGEDKAIQVVHTDLYDFELEIEPVLQVLVGKCVENARIEVIEEWEKDELKKHKSKFQ